MAIEDTLYSLHHELPGAAKLVSLASATAAQQELRPTGRSVAGAQWVGRASRRAAFRVGSSF
ncbi:MAG: hypothetical protein WB586_10635 [Chthoniobacterales bacterium]